MADFDPYRKWLGIPDGQRPPTHYQLLGISPSEHDLEVISAACIRQSAFVRNFQAGQHAEDAARILTEIAAAKVCLADARKRAAYDQELKPKPPAKAVGSGSSTTIPRPAGRTTSSGKSSVDSATFARRSQSAPAPPAPSPPAPSPPAPSPPAPSPPTPSTPAPRATASRATASRATAPRATAPQPPPVRYAEADTDDDADFALPLGPLQSMPLPPMMHPVVPARIPRYTAPRARGFRVEVWHVAVAAAVAAVVLVFVIGTLVSRLGKRASSIAWPGGSPEVEASQPAQPQPAGENPASAPAPGGNASVGASSIPNVTTPGGSPNSTSPPGSSAPTTAAPSNSTSVPGGNGLASSATPSNPPVSPSAPSTRYANLRVPPVEWGSGEGTLTIANETDATPIISRGGRFLALDNEIWDTSSGKRIGQCGPAGTASERAALSPDGQSYAVTADSYTDRINVYSVAQGRRIWTLVFKYGKAELVFLEFADDEHLVAIWRGSSENRVQLWDFAAGKAVAEMDMERFDGTRAAISPNGEQIAVAFDRGIQVFDLHKRKLLATAVRDENERLLGCDGLSFSPDGQEIAAVCQGGGRILAWNGSVELTYDHQPNGRIRGSRSGAVYRGPAIAYLPDRSGWLLYGHTLYDRKRQQPAIQIQSSPRTTARHVLLADNRLLIARGTGVSSRLADLRLPWDQFERAREARKLSDEDRPSIKLTLSGSIPTTSQESLRLALTRRLNAVGYTVGSGDIGELRAVYSEKSESRQITEVEPGAITPGGGFREPRVVTRTVQVPVGMMDLSLIAPDGRTVVWQDAARAEGDTPIAGISVTQRTAVERIESVLYQSMMPLLVPHDGDLLSLPVVVDISR